MKSGCLMLLTHDDVRVVWAAMIAMVDDVHCPQDQLTEEQRTRAKEIRDRLDALVNADVL